MAGAEPMILSFVERGWRGARELSLELLEHGVAVTHVVKGRLDPDVRGLIPPRPNVRLVSVERRWFLLLASSLLLQGALSRRLRSVLVDNERSLRRWGPWVRLLGKRIAMIEETSGGYRLRPEDRELIAPGVRPGRWV